MLELRGFFAHSANISKQLLLQSMMNVLKLADGERC